MRKVFGAVIPAILVNLLPEIDTGGEEVEVGRKCYLKFS